MDRRRFNQWMAGAGALGVAPLAHAVETAAPRRAAKAAGFDVVEATIAQLQQAMASGALRATQLTAAYLARIEAVDRRGPTLRSIIELDPDAMARAAELDRERRAGRVRGPLHGIPILLKDNIATHGPMRTTAGSLALLGAPAPRDAHLVKRLREAGAVILGKTNLSEWANIRSTRSTSGWSARGGLTRNPYALDRNTSGSSSGSAVAVAASLCAAAIGTETDGSIVSPASINGVVGLKPTVGRVSRDGIVPISQTQDTAGPMTRTVADAALVLAALAGTDARDEVTKTAPPLEATLGQGQGLSGRRLGVVRGAFGAQEEVSAVVDRALALLKAQGAVLVDPVELPTPDALGTAELDVLLTEFKHGLARYLAEFAPTAPVRNLADLVEWNRRHADREMPWFGQELFEQALTKGGLDSPGYLESLATCQRLARTEGIDKVLREQQLDALIAPTGGPAWVTDPVNGDHFGGSFSTPAAIAGYPHLTVPAGYVHGLPVGLSFVGPAWSEALLIGLGAAYEQAANARQAPTYQPTINM